MRLLQGSIDSLYGPVAGAYGRFRLRRRFVVLRSDSAFPTNTDEITVLDDAGTEFAVVSLPHNSDLATTLLHLKRWLQGEAARLVSLELDLRRQRRVAADASSRSLHASASDTTAQQWQEVSASNAARLRVLWERNGFSQEEAREHMERFIGEMGEEPEMGANVVLWWQLSVDERYQRYELVERGLYELEDGNTEGGDTRTEDISESSQH